MLNRREIRGLLKLTTFTHRSGMDQLPPHLLGVLSSERPLGEEEEGWRALCTLSMA